MKQGALGHPKMRRLARSLGLPRLHAAGMVEALFHFTNEYAYRGDVGRFSDDEIADVLEWGGDPAALTTALLEAGWADYHPIHRLVIHDWPDHAPDYTKRKANGIPDGKGGWKHEPVGWAVDDVNEDSRSDSAICDNPQNTNTTGTKHSGQIQTSPEKSGLPNLAMPNQTKPTPKESNRGSSPKTTLFPESPPDDWIDDLAKYLLEHGTVRTACRRKALHAFMEAGDGPMAAEGKERKTRRGWLAYVKRGIKDEYFLKGWAKANEAYQQRAQLERRQALAVRTPSSTVPEAKEL